VVRAIQGVNRDFGWMGFVVLLRRWPVERSFGWLAYRSGLARDRAGRLDVSPDASPSPPFCPRFGLYPIHGPYMPLGDDSAAQNTF
jgi:hypothetical protein